MKTITLELPDNIASIFEALPHDRKLKAALLTAFLAQRNKKSTYEVLSDIDERAVGSGVSEAEIDQWIEELS